MRQARRSLALLLLAAPWLVLEPAGAQPALTELGGLDLPNETLDVAIEGTRAVVLADSGLVVLDITDPSAPVRLGSSERPFGMGAPEAAMWLNDLAVAGSTAAVTGGTMGLAIFDLTDPAAPAVVGSLPATGRLVDVELAGDVAYLADSYQGGLRVVDLSDPSQPAQLVFLDRPSGLYAPGGTEIDAIDLAGSRLVASGRARRIGELDSVGILWVLDVSTPATPATVGVLETDAVGDVALAGDLAYVAATGTSQIAVFDLSDPGAPDELDPIAASSTVFDVEAADGVLFYTRRDGTGSLLQASVPAPPGPPTGDSRLLEDPAPRLAVAGGIAVTTEDSGITITDVSDSNFFVSHGTTLDEPDDGVAIEVVGTRAYVANAGMDLRVYDVSVETSPEVRSFVELDGTDARSLALSGPLAFVGGKAVVRILDVSDPDAPAEVGAIPLFGIATSLAVSGTTLFVAEAFESPDPPGIRAFDVSDPGSPDELGSFPTPANPMDLALTGATLDVALAGDSVRILDVASPALPDEIGSVPVAGNEVERRREMLITIDRVHYNNVGECGGSTLHRYCDDLVLWNASVPSAPVRLGSVHLAAVGSSMNEAGNPTDLALAPVGLAYVGPEYATGNLSDSRELLFVDDSDPADPVVVARQDAPGFSPYPWVRAVDVEGERLYAAGIDGLRIFALPVPEPDAQALGLVAAGAMVALAGSRRR